jgi:zinc transporter
MASLPASGVLADATLKDGARWVHLDRHEPAATAWLAEESGLPDYLVDALLAEETRPRCHRHGDGVLVILRGVNLNPGAVPEDMVSLRMWIDSERILSCRLRRLMAVHSLSEALAAGGGPERVGAFIASLAEGLTERMEPVILAMDDEIDEAEAAEDESDLSKARLRLRMLRRRVTILRRYINPQREALSRLAGEEVSWLTDQDRADLRETSNDVTRLVETLNAIWERAAILQEELSAALTEQTNERLYILSIVAGVFLPLSFVTGLLGMNVAGMPGIDTSWAFWAVCGILGVCTGVELWLFRKLRWL